jgi:putative transposase
VRIRAQIDELFAAQQELGQVLEQVARLSVRLVMPAALEAEISEFLGRDRSRLLGKGVSRTNALEALVISGFVGGLSTRDVEAALGEALGPEAALGKSTVSRICQAIKDEFDAWKPGDLGGIEPEYLFLDGSHVRMHPRASRAGAVRLGHHHPGQPGAAGAGTRRPRGPRPWAGFPGELVARGLRAPLLVITDGAPGLIGAVEVVFSRSLRQRCLVHRARNLLARVPTHAQDEVKAAFWQIFDDITADPGQLAVDQARRRAEAFADRDGKRYPAASPVCWIACRS